MIEAHGLVKRYGSTTAVNDLSFSIRPGLVTGFLGSGQRGRGAMRVSRRADPTGERGCAPTICDRPGRKCAKIALLRLCISLTIES